MADPKPGLLKRLFGSRLMDWLSAYDDYLLWQGVLPRLLPQGAADIAAHRRDPVMGHEDTEPVRQRIG